MHYESYLLYVITHSQLLHLVVRYNTLCQTLRHSASGAFMDLLRPAVTTPNVIHDNRVGFLPEETYFFQDNGRNMVSSVFFHFLPEEMEEWDL